VRSRVAQLAFRQPPPRLLLRWFNLGYPPHHLSHARAIYSAGLDPGARSAAPSHHSNAPIRPESQSILSKIIARFLTGLRFNSHREELFTKENLFSAKAMLPETLDPKAGTGDCRLYRSAISARLLYLREIDCTAFWDFCNSICQKVTHDKNSQACARNGAMTRAT
jgi:hypothetical protein